MSVPTFGARPIRVGACAASPAAASAANIVRNGSMGVPRRRGCAEWDSSCYSFMLRAPPKLPAPTRPDPGGLVGREGSQPPQSLLVLFAGRLDRLALHPLPFDFDPVLGLRLVQVAQAVLLRHLGGGQLQFVGQHGV